MAPKKNVSAYLKDHSVTAKNAFKSLEFIEQIFGTTALRSLVVLVAERDGFRDECERDNEFFRLLKTGLRAEALNDGIILIDGVPYEWSDSEQEWFHLDSPSHEVEDDS